jgi:hypothetical protein
MTGDHALRGPFVTVILALMFPGSQSVPALGRSGAERTDPGCDATRQAVAHYGGGFAARRPRGSAPIPCATFVGPTSESAASPR